MRTIFGTACGILIGISALGGGSAWADSGYYQNNQQFGVNLPQAAVPNGSDEIRTADGVSCRSAVGGDGAYLDIGVLGSPDSSDMNATAAAYGRIVIPLGGKAKRLDCSKLYALEIQRLQMELQLARMGMNGSGNTSAAGMNDNWAEEGWGQAPAAQPQPVADKPPQQNPVSKPAKKSRKPVKPKAAPIESIY